MNFSHEYQIFIDNARKLLSEAGIWDVESDLECLVDRYLERRNKEQAYNEFMLAVYERCNRIPLGHIVNSINFDGLPLVVGSGVFVPRTHSQLIHKWINKESNIPFDSTVLDLCSGCGAIGLSIAKRRPDLNVVCVEYDTVAFQYLVRNINRLSSLSIKAQAFQTDLRDLQSLDKFKESVSLIVANPPYVPEKYSILPEWEKHHPYVSVYSGDDGLDLIRLIIIQSKQSLKANGWLVIEHQENQQDVIRNLFLKEGFSQVRTIIDNNFSDTTGLSVITIGINNF
ncbi:N5-glutamine methyltransferase family protein [Xenorhabdus doucetiae]|uniref:peptide chain release factor N(5)-glutamine methyltransferase n=1 Tax=Xenorhabdus doucetiae TaxID=351671 RepID=A0A068QVM5_9GAMM|nr:HemK/PrmC family methyltransferase [Xenorhabdus doucetiae]TYO93320.1 release factor glutamine methyltransferase [Xenorhabdus doucetiae]CDG19023.1 putative Similar to methylase and with protoporphyrinogen oxidase [Xenorhabdus doucetiae]